MRHCSRGRSGPFREVTAAPSPNQSEILPEEEGDERPTVKAIWDAAIEDARAGRSPRPVMTFAKGNEALEYSKAYSRALSSLNRSREFFGNQKWWRSPKREWDELLPLWDQNIHTRPGAHHYYHNRY